MNYNNIYNNGNEFQDGGQNISNNSLSKSQKISPLNFGNLFKKKQISTFQNIAKKFENNGNKLQNEEQNVPNNSLSQSQNISSNIFGNLFKNPTVNDPFKNTATSIKNNEEQNVPYGNENENQNDINYNNIYNNGNDFQNVGQNGPYGNENENQNEINDEEQIGPNNSLSQNQNISSNVFGNLFKNPTVNGPFKKPTNINYENNEKNPNDLFSQNSNISSFNITNAFKKPTNINFKNNENIDNNVNKKKINDAIFKNLTKYFKDMNNENNENNGNNYNNGNNAEKQVGNISIKPTKVYSFEFDVNKIINEGETNYKRQFKRTMDGGYETFKNLDPYVIPRSNPDPNLNYQNQPIDEMTILAVRDIPVKPTKTHSIKIVKEGKEMSKYINEDVDGYKEFKNVPSVVYNLPIPDPNAEYLSEGTYVWLLGRKEEPVENKDEKNKKNDNGNEGNNNGNNGPKVE